ncbi:MAG TPA: Lrp/AsnC family transcriptional regulator [Steroidobacteraceae bacterium]
MDALDLRILAALNADARRPYAELARELEVSQPTIADRVRRLEERGIIRGTMLCIDPARLGYPIIAFVRIRSNAPKERVLDTFRDMPQITELHSVTGEDCLIARVVARSVEELGTVLERISVFGTSSTSIVLGTPIPLRNPLPMPKTAETNAKGTRNGAGKRVARNGRDVRI